VLNAEQDTNILICGRSDIGSIMKFDGTPNWNTTAMTVRVRTMDQVGKLGCNTEFYEMYISGKINPGSVDLRYYIDGQASTYDAEYIDQTGVTKKSGIGDLLNVADQVRFNDYIHTKYGFNVGETLGIEIFDDDLNRKFEIYEILVNTIDRGRKISKVVGG
jgi:hypothetical protein